MLINDISFCGISKPYTNEKGYRVIPISKNPTQKDITKACFATIFKKPHSGMNGSSYFYGRDLVVKRYFDKNKAYNYNPDREISVLDNMYENGLNIENNQIGHFAFTSPKGKTYLVSSKVQGKTFDSKTNKFNEKNLKALIDIFSKMDMPVYDETLNENSNFPYKVFMHYDLSKENYNINENSAGIFDFEYARFENIDRFFNPLRRSSNPDLSDIPETISNLRSFEYRGLLPYLAEIEPKEARELFKTYLSIKKDYHNKRAQFYKNEFSKRNIDELKTLFSKEKAHAKCLEKQDENIIKSEAIKIQIAGFIYAQSFFAPEENKINPKQIEEYLLMANKYFENMLQKAQNQEEKIYFKDCLELTKAWNGVVYLMKMNANKPQYPDYLSGKTQEEKAEIFKRNIEFYNKFTNKITNDYSITLDEIIY